MHLNPHQCLLRCPQQGQTSRPRSLPLGSPPRARQRPQRVREGQTPSECQSSSPQHSAWSPTSGGKSGLDGGVERGRTQPQSAKRERFGGPGLSPTLRVGGGGAEGDQGTPATNMDRSLRARMKLSFFRAMAGRVLLSLLASSTSTDAQAISTGPCPDVHEGAHKKTTAEDGEARRHPPRETSTERHTAPTEALRYPSSDLSVGKALSSRVCSGLAARSVRPPGRRG